MQHSLKTLNFYSLFCTSKSFWVRFSSLTQKVSDDCGLGSLTELGKESSGSSEGINWNKAKGKKEEEADRLIWQFSAHASWRHPALCWNDDILFAKVPVFRVLELQCSRVLKNSYNPHKRKSQNSPQSIFSDRGVAREAGKCAFSTRSCCFRVSLLKRQWVQSKGWWITSNNSPSSLQCVEQRVV